MNYKMNYKKFPVIENAIFFDNDENIISYHDLPEDTTIFVSGNVGSLKINRIECIVNGNILISSFGVKYTFIPSNASLIENAIELDLRRFINTTDKITTIFVNPITAVKTAQEWINSGKKVSAVGILRSPHYRITDTKRIKTSSIKDITMLPDSGDIYIHTCNSVYHANV